MPSNPLKPTVNLNRVGSSAPSNEIELLSQLKFSSEALRAAFAAYLSGPYLSPTFLEVISGGPDTVAQLDVDPFTVPIGKHIIAVDHPQAFYIYRLNDVGGLPADDHPKIVLPIIPAGARYWELAFLFDYSVEALQLFGSKIDLAGGGLFNVGTFGFSSATQRRNALRATVQWEDGIDEYVGTGTSLETIPTELLNVGIIIEFKHATEGLRKFRLRFGNDASNPGIIVRGLDYLDFTNEKVWETLA